MTTTDHDFSVHLDYPALFAWVVDAAGAGDHDHCVAMAAKQALFQKTSAALDAMHLIGCIENIGDTDHSESRYSFDYLATVEVEGAIHRVRVYVDSAVASAILLFNERFTSDATFIVAVSLGCGVSDVHLTETESPKHFDIDVSTDSVEFHAAYVRRDVPSLLLALKQKRAPSPSMVNDRR